MNITRDAVTLSRDGEMVTAAVTLAAEADGVPLWTGTATAVINGSAPGWQKKLKAMLEAEVDKLVAEAKATEALMAPKAALEGAVDARLAAAREVK
jgi:hypothetical protein